MKLNLGEIIEHCGGGVSVEAALVLPFVIVAGLGATDASFLILQNHKMESQLAMAGNYLSKSRNPSTLESQAKRLARTGQITAGGTPLIAGWKESDISFSYKTVPNASVQNGLSYRGGDTVRIIQVSSQTDYQGFGLIRAISGGTIQLRAGYEERIVGDDQA